MFTCLIAGIITLTSSPANVLGQTPNTERWTAFLSYATRWSQPFAALLILLSLGLAWWQIRGWTERLDALDEADEEAGVGEVAPPDEEYREAISHLMRSGSLI